MNSEPRQDNEASWTTGEGNKILGGVLMLLGAFLVISSFASASYLCVPPPGLSCQTPTSLYIQFFGLFVSGIGVVLIGIYIMVRKEKMKYYSSATSL